MQQRLGHGSSSNGDGSSGSGSCARLLCGVPHAGLACSPALKLMHALLTFGTALLHAAGQPGGQV